MSADARLMEPDDLVSVQAIHALCHPGWPERSALWWHAHPTLVLEAGGHVIGSTSFSVSIATDRDFETKGAEIAYGHGLSVAPDFRGQGFGWALIEARRAVLRELGIGFFIGYTQPENKAVITLFRRQGLAYHAAFPRFYPDGGTGLMYAGAVR